MVNAGMDTDFEHLLTIRAATIRCQGVVQEKRVKIYALADWSSPRYILVGFAP